ncbi:MAG: gluconokinase [Bacteroidota bacterium]
MRPISIVMGVSGSGKSTVGQLLAKKLGVVFLDADDYHPKANVRKMRSGRPLNDTDRKGWLDSLNAALVTYSSQGAVLACSALKQKYRDRISKGMEDQIRFIYLEGSFETLWKRLQLRQGHFMPASLLQSQFDTLEAPQDAITVSAANTPETILAEILAAM